MAVKISLCMIARNEEHNIGRCLQSVKGVVDEIIVVDTGSSDNTCQIAKSLGAKIKHFIWNDNFSDARNASLELAAGDWILFLDADEELTKESRAVLRRAVLQPEIEGYFIKIVNVAGDDSCPETNADTVFRLFRNRPDYRFRGAVHEQICNAILEKKGQIQFPYIEDLIINHYGYLNSQIEEKNKKSRNRVLLEKELINNPDDCLLRFHYAVELFRMGESLSAAQEFDRLSTIVNPKEVIYGSRLMRYIVLAYYAGNELTAALTAVQRGLVLFPDYADLYYYGGAIYYQLKEYGLAYDNFQKAMDAPVQPVYYASGAGIQGFRTYYYLGQIAEKFCNEEEALRYYIESLRDNSSFPAALESIMGILQPRENPEYTKYAIDKICDVSMPQAKLLMGKLLFKHGAYGLALEYFEDVPEALSEGLLLYKAICLMQQRRGSEALTILELLDRSGNMNPTVKFNKLLCFWLEDNKQRVWDFGGKLLTIGLTEDTAAVVELLRNSHKEKTQMVLGSEGMVPILEAVNRGLDLGDSKRCTLLLSGISHQSLKDYYLPLGEMFYQYRHLELAEQYLCQHIQEKKDSDRACFLLAEIKLSQGAYFAAIEYYKQAMQTAPQEPKYYVKLIKLYEKLRSETLEQGTKKYPQFPILASLSEESGAEK